MRLLERNQAVAACSPFMNASKSALIWFALVVGMPCGKPGYFAAKGFKGQLLEDVVSTITSNRETWVSTMMNEELHLQPVAQQSLAQSALVVTVATLIGHFMPIVPFMVAARTPAIVLAIALSAVTSSPWESILRRPWSETGGRAACKW